MNRILVGIDGSKESLQAALVAANLAHAMHAELQLACIITGELPEDLLSGPLDRGQQILLEASERVARPETASRTTLIESPDPADALAELAQAPEVDMVVVGHRARSAMARTLLGSVADRLVQISSKPVLVVR